MVIAADDEQQFHDTPIVNGVTLDVFVCPLGYFEGEYEFVQIYDGHIITDSNGIGKRLQASVQVYLRNRSVKSREEIQASVDWCVKMFERAKRGDCEGMFRWHWVLIDSLEILL